jgi:carbonic anhydrase/acetyltransferase-like protein (isoleucine patch superfamily)/dTDP-4-dehydrorhamnose 3,5-epimerase-like enzyme
LSGAVIGRDSTICEHVFIEHNVTIGDRVTVKCGVQLWDGVVLEDDVFVGPNATFTNDPFPRSRRHLDVYPSTVVRKGASVGGNATILPGITIGTGAMIGAGAVVTRDVPPFAIVAGNPSRITGYVSAGGPTGAAPAPATAGPGASVVKGVKLYDLPHVLDMRGSLSVAEVGKQLPFQPKRYFIVFDVPSAEVRGEHAHKTLHQFVVCVKGSMSLVVDDGEHRQEYVLDRPDRGLHIQPMVWATQYKYTADAVQLVLASDVYDAEDYIRDYDEFLKTASVGRVRR